MSMYSESLRAFLRPVLPFLDDPEVTEIMINGPTEIWVEKAGKIERTDARFSEEGLDAAARNMAQFVGRVLNDERPRLDARLPDGSRIHLVLPPVARQGTTVAIRKFAKDRLSMQRLVEIGAATTPMAKLIEAAVRLKLNVIVAGGTGSGKTTLLNVLSRYISDDERILTIEDSAELQLQQPHIVGFESRPPDKFGKGEVSIGDLLDSSLRLRPDRIVVGEVRGGECFHLLQAMNTGHGGSLSTTHANTPTDTLRRLESLCLMSGVELPIVAIRSQVASAIQLLIVCERFQDGTRKITHVSEVLSLDERGDYRTQDLFVYTPTGRDPESGRVKGFHAPTGVLPTFLRRARVYGVDDVDEAFFDPATYDLPPPPTYTADLGAKTKWAPSLKHRAQGLPDPEPVRSYEEVSTFGAASLETAATRSADEASAPPEEAGTDAAPPSRARAPEPVEPPRSALTEDTPRHGVPAPETAEPNTAESASESEAKTVELQPVEKPVEKPGEVKPVEKPRPRVVVDEPSIQIAEDLLEDVQRAIGNDRTQLKRNPLLDPPGPAPATKPSPPPVAPGARNDASPPPPRLGNPKATRRTVEDDKTDPHIRMPSK